MFNNNFSYTAYVRLAESQETYASNDPTALLSILDEYKEMFGEEDGAIGLVDNATGEILYLRIYYEAFGHVIIDEYKTDFFKEYFE